jgi:starch synthase
MKSILFAASECVPFIKTGGLADVCGALPSYINKDEFDVRVILPYYTCIPAKFRDNFKKHSATGITIWKKFLMLL